MTHPDDANRDALRRMETQGDNLHRARKIEFTVVFSEQDSANQFARHMRTLGYEASIDLSETAEGFPWDVIVVKHMVPCHSEIEKFEATLESVAAAFGGHNDGWGCFPQPSEDQ